MKTGRLIFVFAVTWLSTLHAGTDGVIGILASVVEYSKGGVRGFGASGEPIVQDFAELRISFPKELGGLRVPVMTSESSKPFWEKSVGEDIEFLIGVDQFNSLLELRRQLDSGKVGAYWALREPDLSYLSIIAVEDRERPNDESIEKKQDGE